MNLPLCYLVDVQFQKCALLQPCTVSLGVAEEGDTDQFHITASSLSQYPCCTGQSYPSGSNGVNFIINGKSGNDCWLSMSKKSIMQKRKANITLLLLRTRKSYHLLYLFTDAHKSDAASCQNLPLHLSEEPGWVLVDLANISGIVYVMMHLNDFNNCADEYLEKLWLIFLFFWFY